MKWSAASELLERAPSKRGHRNGLLLVGGKIKGRSPTKLVYPNYKHNMLLVADIERFKCDIGK